MNDPSKTSQELLDENAALRQKIRELGQTDADRKPAEKERGLSQQQLQLLIDSGPDFFFLKDLDLRYQLVNDANARFFGRDKADIVGRTDIELMPREAAVACQESDRRALREQKTVVTVEPVGDRYYETYKFPVTDAGEIVGVAGIARDITARRRAEEDLRQSEMHLRAIAESARDAIVIMSDDGLITHWNGAAERMFGYSPDYAIGKELHALLAPQRYHDSYLKGLDHFQKSGKGGAIGKTMEFSAVRKGGEEFPVELSLSVEHMQGRWVAIGILRDITSRKREEEALHRLNREVKAISRCRQAVLQAEEEQTLLDDICRIICDEAGYRMVWVGYADHDEAKTVRPIAWAGAEDGYLMTANVAWADTERGRGPTGTAVRTGETVYIQDFAGDPRTTPWCEGALQRGYHSEIALPLKNENKTTFGALNIYSAVPNAFTPEEIRLLEELAGDLAFGIMVLRERDERKRAQDALLESEIKYRTLIENSVAGVYIYQDGLFRFANKRFCEIYGYTEEEMVNKLSALDLTHPEEKHSLDEAIERCLSGEKGNINLTHRAIKKDGSFIIVSVLGSPMIYRGRPALSGTVLDITEQERAAEALKASEEKYRDIFENAVEGIFQTTPEGLGLGINPAFARMFGYGSAEEMMESITDIAEQVYVDPQDRERFQEMLGDQGIVQGFETQLYRRDGDKIWVSVNARAVKDAGGKVLYYEGTAEDITKQRKIEEELRRSHAMYRTIFDNSGTSMIIIDEDTTIVLCNGEWTRLSGYSREETEGRMRWTEFVHEEDLAAMRKYHDRRRVDPADGPRRYEFRCIDRHGNIHNLINTVAMIPGTKLSLAAQLDITDLKQAEEALRISEATLRSVFAAAPVGIVIGDMNRMPRWANEAMISITGYAQEDLKETGTRIFYASEEEYTHVADALLGGITRDGVGITDTKWVRKNGETRDVHLRAAPIDPKNMEAGLVFTAVDITDQKRAEKAILESEEKYRSVVENSPVGFYIVKDGLFRYVNRRFCEILGYTYEDLVDKRGPLDNVHPDDRDLMAENLRKRTAGEADRIEYDFRGVRKDGRIVTLRAIGTTMMYEGQRVASGSILDITREKSLEERLFQSQKMEALGTLAGGIAHDFNNILTALTGYGTLLQMKMDQADPLHVYVDQILSASDKASQLTHGLLAFSRQQPIALTHVDINGLIRGTEKLLKRLLTEDIELKTALASRDITVMADATQIDQILFNLATNARDAMPQGGMLTITTEAVELDEGFRHVHGYGEPGTYALLSVSDTGAGMDKMTQEHIFDPFFTTKEAGKGTGLGLSTVYGVVKQHSGYITVYSEPNMGTTFHIYLPSATRAGKEERKAHISARGGNETILIAEDSEPVRGLISRILTQYGYRTIEAVDGLDAVERFRTAWNIDLIVLDSVMPRMNGREAYNEICKIKPDIKVIFTSGYTKDVFLDKGVEDGEFNFLQKPISPGTILQKVREVLDKKTLR